MGMVGTAMHVGTLATFDHRHHGFDLGAVAVGIPVEANLHQPTIVSGRRLRRGATMLGRNDRADVPLSAGDPVIGFGVVPGVGNHPRQAHLLQSVGHQRPKLVHVRPWPAARAPGQNEMATRVAHQAQLGIAMINHGFPRACDAISASYEVGAGTAAF